MSMEAQWRSGSGLGLADSEDAAALVMERPVGDELVNESARLKRRIQLERRLRPQRAALDLRLDVFADAFVADREEALGVPSVVIDELISERKDVH
jgi:hypothetical protein